MCAPQKQQNSAASIAKELGIEYTDADVRQAEQRMREFDKRLRNIGRSDIAIFNAINHKATMMENKMYQCDFCGNVCDHPEMPICQICESEYNEKIEADNISQN